MKDHFCLTALLVQVCHMQAKILNEDSRYVHYWERAYNSSNFVDNTMLLKEFLEGHTFPLITCPEGFGKSTNLDMARRFFEYAFDPSNGNESNFRRSHYFQLFSIYAENLKIQSEQTFLSDHLCRYPILYFNFGNVQGKTCAEIIKSIMEEIARAVAPYRWLFDRMKERLRFTKCWSLELKLENWEKIIKKTGNQTNYWTGVITMSSLIIDYFDQDLMVFMDNYDAPSTLAISLGLEDATEVDTYIHELISEFTNGVARYVMIAGMSRLFRQGTKSHLLKAIRSDHFLESSSSLVKYFGFDDSQVNELLDTKHIFGSDRRKVKRYFNGYRYKGENITVYNPTGVLQYIDNQQLEYHHHTGYLIRKFMKCSRHEKFFTDIVHLLTKQGITSKMDRYLSERDLNNYVEIVRNNCTELPRLVPYKTVFFDNGYLTYNDGLFQISNVVMENKLKREFADSLHDIYGINVTNADVAVILRSLLKHKTTSNEKITSLTHLLQQLFQSKLNQSCDEFQFRSIIIGVLCCNLESYENVKVKEANKTHESFFVSNDKLKISNRGGKCLLIVKITLKGLESAIADARKFVPLEPRNTSTIILVKYLGISLKENKVEVGKGEDRHDW